MVANVGDSDALLGGKLSDGSIGFEQLCADHAPTNVDEYIRMAQLAMSRPKGWEPAVSAYDTDAGSPLAIFKISEQVNCHFDVLRDAQAGPIRAIANAPRDDRHACCFDSQGEVDLDRGVLDRLDELNVGFKTVRGDRPTALFVLETESYGQQKLAVTRSLGDFYMQYHGATWDPTVSCIDLFDVARQLDQVAKDHN